MLLREIYTHNAQLAGIRLGTIKLPKNMGTHHLAGKRHNNQVFQIIKEGNSSYGFGWIINRGIQGGGVILAVKTGCFRDGEMQQGASQVDCNPEENSSTQCEIGGIMT